MPLGGVVSQGTLPSAVVEARPKRRCVAPPQRGSGSRARPSCAVCVGSYGSSGAARRPELALLPSAPPVSLAPPPLCGAVESSPLPPDE